MASEEEYLEFRSWVEQKVVPHVGNAVVPIYKCKNESFFLERTGILMRAGTHSLLVTANHGLHEWLEHEFEPFTSPNAIDEPPIPLWFANSFISRDENDPCDVAFFELHEDSIELLDNGSRRFLQPGPVGT